MKCLSPQTADFDHFTLSISRGWQRNVPTCKMQVKSVHSYSFCSLNRFFVALSLSMPLFLLRLPTKDISMATTLAIYRPEEKTKQNIT